PETRRAGAAIPRDSDPGQEPPVRSPATGRRSFACRPVTQPASQVSPGVRRIVQVTGRGILRCPRSAERTVLDARRAEIVAEPGCELRHFTAPAATLRRARRR